MSGALRIVLLLVALVPLVGSKCGPQAPAVALRLEPASAVVSPGAVVELDVVAELDSQPLQAFDLEVSATAGMLAAFAAEPHADFDDDGALFVEPLPNLGGSLLRRIVDVRHGATPASGAVVLARVRVLALAKGSGVVSISDAGLARPDGGGISSTVADATITVQSP